MKKFLSILAIASIVMVSCDNKGAEGTNPDSTGTGTTTNTMTGTDTSSMGTGAGTTTTTGSDTTGMGTGTMGTDTTGRSTTTTPTTDTTRR